jgi:predicted nucleic acid-binding protein
VAKPTVYIETTVISYLTSRPSRNLIVAAHQLITVEWWRDVLPELTPYISIAIVDEISKGDPVMAAMRLDAVKDFPELEITSEVRSLAARYISKLQLPHRSITDATHLACASWYGVDYVATWNMAHIASAKVRAVLNNLNRARGVSVPVLCTPEELMEL